MGQGRDVSGRLLGACGRVGEGLGEPMAAQPGQVRGATVRTNWQLVCAQRCHRQTSSCGGKAS